MGEEGYVPKKKGPLGAAKLVRVSAEDDNTLAKKLDSLNDELSRSLAEQEEQKRATLAQSVIKHQEVSGKVKGLYDQASDRYSQLVKQERMLSSQAGQLLNGLQREESQAGVLSATVRKIRHTRKKLLTRISAPRWEVPHHFHMTCIEHVLGHSQPHVLEVGQMVPGHLRIFCFARVNTLIQKSLIFSLNRTKTARFGFSDKLKEVYRSLQLTRAEIKEQEKMLQMMRERSHLMPGRMSDPREVERSLSTRNSGAQAIRTRYLNSLHLSQNYEPEVQELPGAETQPEERKEWKQVLALLGDLEHHSLSRIKASEELGVLESCRERFKVGVEGLPSIVGFDSALAASMADADDELMDQQMETLAESTDKLAHKKGADLGEAALSEQADSDSASTSPTREMRKLFVSNSSHHDDGETNHTLARTPTKESERPSSSSLAKSLPVSIHLSSEREGETSSRPKVASSRNPSGTSIPPVLSYLEQKR